MILDATETVLGTLDLIELFTEIQKREWDNGGRNWSMREKKKFKRRSYKTMLVCGSTEMISY
jgi:hypothetical protein